MRVPAYSIEAAKWSNALWIITSFFLIIIVECQNVFAAFRLFNGINLKFVCKITGITCALVIVGIGFIYMIRIVGCSFSAFDAGTV